MPAKLREYWVIGTWAFLFLACAYSIALRGYFAWELPLWIDESWTALLSAAPTLHSFTYQMWLDSNAPAYYLFMWLWPFESDFGLRLPSILFLLGAAVAASGSSALSRDQKLFWAALLILWPEGVSLFQDARYYGLLYFLATLQTIAYVALLREPTLRRACVWTGLSTLAILTHYYAAVFAAFQGFYYLWQHRGCALKTWPSLILLAPAFGWLAFHWPRLKLYALAGTSWYSKIDPIEALKLALFPWGGWWIGILVVTLAAVMRRREPISASAAAVGLTAFASMFVLIVVGMFYPVLTPRYLLPAIPPLLYCAAVSVRPVSILPISALMFLPASGFSAWWHLLNDRANYGLERAAQFIPPDSNVVDRLSWIPHS